MNGAGAGIGRLRGQLATLTLALREILTVVQNGQSYLRYDIMAASLPRAPDLHLAQQCEIVNGRFRLAASILDRCAVSVIDVCGGACALTRLRRRSLFCRSALHGSSAGLGSRSGNSCRWLI